MDKIRISQIAKEIGKTSKEILQKAQELGFEVKTASSAVTTEQAEELYNYVLSGKSVEIKTSKEETKKSTKTDRKSVDSMANRIDFLGHFVPIIIFHVLPYKKKTIALTCLHWHINKRPPPLANSG